ncbi:MAG: hypothetical protein GY928_13005 [Colwellia sp.]|nr:hypothetical protein [Colwellia sp.]
MNKYIFLMMLLFSNTSLASEATGQIVEVRSGPAYGSVVAFTLSPVPTNQPNCHNLGTRGHYVIDTAKPGGNGWLSIILSAHAAKKSVHIWGRGICISAAGGFNGEELETLASQ